MTSYLVYDVFTDVPFGGNQLAIFPDATPLPENRLQQIAAEFNYSEVTFVYPPENKDNSARVRIFTPTSEIDFAGHPIIGTVTALAKLGYASPMVLELGVGPLTCTFEDGRAAFTTAVPLQQIAKPDPAIVAEAMGLPETAIRTDTHPPIQASLGLPFVLTEIKSRDFLRDCLPVTDHFRKGAKLYPAGLDFAIYAYCRNGNHIDARMFAPLDNIPEDPATGSASATIAALLTQILDAPQSLSFLQGEDMGRPSYIWAETTLDPLSVTISGKAVQTMSGKFHL